MFSNNEEDNGFSVSSKNLTSEEVQRAVLRYKELKDAEAQLRSLVGSDQGRQRALEELATLEAKSSTEELTDVEKDIVLNLREVIRSGVPAPTHVYLESLLLKRVGPEKYKKIQLKRENHAQELDFLERSNAELQRQVDLISKLENVPVETDIGPTFSVDAFQNDRSGVTIKREPGSYLVEVDRKGKVTAAFRVTPKTLPDDMRPTRWQRIKAFFKR